MKVPIQITTEAEAKWVTIEVPVRYEEEDIPKTFPLRSGDMWKAKVDVDTGQIANWSGKEKCGLHMKVTDCGIYRIIDEHGGVLLAIEQDYVPSWIPGQYGDYIDLEINETGIITNWSTRKIKEAFAKSEE